MKSRTWVFFIATFTIALSCQTRDTNNTSNTSETGATDLNKSNTEEITRKPSIVELLIDSSQHYNLRSLRGSAFLEIPVPKDIYPFLQATIQSYAELEMQIQQHSYDKPEVMKTVGSTADSPYQLSQKDSLWNTIELNYKVPLVDFDELTLISFTTEELNPYNCVKRLEYEVIPAFDKGQLIILTNGSRKKGCIEPPGRIRSQLKWFLVPKMPVEVEVKREYKEEMI